MIAARIASLRQSLRVQLLAWIVVMLIGTLCLNAIFSFLQARTTAELIADNTLRGSARMIAEAIHVDELGNTIVDIPPAALEIFDTGHADRVYYKVTSAWGNLMAGYAELPAPPETVTGTQIIFRDEPLRAITLEHTVVNLPPEDGIEVTVAVTQAGLRAMQWRLFFLDLRNQILLVLVAAVVTLIGLRRGLSPLLKLREAVVASRGERLDPFDPTLVQTELRPLVEALNTYMRRVQAQMAAQRRFVSNAAHQLRTPLALMATQAGFAARETDPARRTEALQALLRSTRQIARLAEQLLMLTRAEPGSRRPRHMRIDIAAVARDVLAARAEDSLQRGIDLALEADLPAPVTGD
ncbi:MAG TPA: sensor histidine kinase N-terminal domain-containing protein, partial [Paenirhodobacter sp.]